jgi:hypothetical protein
MFAGWDVTQNAESQRLDKRGREPSVRSHVLHPVVLLIVFVALATAVTAEPSAAPEIRVQAAVSTKRPYLGDAVILQINVEQTVEKAPEVDTSALESLGITPLGPPAVGHSRTIINGVSSEKFTFQFQFQFTPTRAGVMEVPAVTVRQGREAAATAPFAIEVIGPEAQDTTLLKLEPSDRAVYPGQTVTFTVSVYLRRLVYQGQLLDADPFGERNPPRLKISWLE